MRSEALSPEFREFEGALLNGRFKVMEMIARGGFATVWKASDRKQSGVHCAVKVFRRELVDHAWMMKRFKQEVFALRQIRHPNVVGICGQGLVTSGAPYLVMEFVEGKTLRERLNESKLTRRQTASYLRQASLALAEIHAHGICHRDLKPENLMIRSSAVPGMELVLIDFSIAIVQDPDETIHGLSRAAGTLHYMATRASHRLCGSVERHLQPGQNSDRDVDRRAAVNAAARTLQLTCLSGFASCLSIRDLDCRRIQQLCWQALGIRPCAKTERGGAFWRWHRGRSGTRNLSRAA